MADPTKTTVTADAGNGNEPPVKLAADAGNGNEPPVKALDAETVDVNAAIAAVPHAAHAWLDKLLDEMHSLDDVMKNRLHHIVAQIRETL